MWRKGANVATSPWGAAQASAQTPVTAPEQSRGVSWAEMCLQGHGVWWWERRGRLCKSRHIHLIMLLDRLHRFWWNHFSDLIYLLLIQILAGSAIFGVKVQVQFLLESINGLVVFGLLTFLVTHVHSFFQLVPKPNCTILEYLEFVTQYPFFKNTADTKNALVKHFIIPIILEWEPSAYILDWIFL